MNYEERKFVLEIKNEDDDNIVIFFIIVVYNGCLDFVKIFLRCKEDIEVWGILKIENKIFNGCML